MWENKHIYKKKEKKQTFLEKKKKIFIRVKTQEIAVDLSLKKAIYGEDFEKREYGFVEIALFS